MARTLTHARIVAAATAATVASSLFLSRPVLAEDQCRSSVVGEKAPKANKVEYTDRLESVTLFVNTDKENQSLAITVPGAVVDGAKDRAGVSEVLLANAKVAIERYLEGKTSSQWECVTLPAKPPAQPYTAVPEAPAPEAAGWNAPAPARPSEAPAPQPAPAAKPQVTVQEDAEEAKKTASVSGEVQHMVASLDGDKRKADKLLTKSTLSDKRLDEAKAAVERREHGVFLAIYNARYTFMVMPAYTHWKAAHDEIANGNVSRNELSDASKHLDEAAKELGQLKPYPKNYSSDPESMEALGVIEHTYNDRDKKGRDAKRDAESSQLQKSIEKLYEQYPQDGQSDSDKISLLQETFNAKNLDKIRQKVGKRKIVTPKKTYTPNGKGDAIADQEALASEVSLLSTRTATRDYDLKFHCAIEAQVTVDGDGHATKVTFLKGPAGYLSNQEFTQRMSDIIGRIDHGPAARNKTPSNRSC